MSGTCITICKLIDIVPKYDENSLLKRWAAGSENAKKIFLDLILWTKCHDLENKIQSLRVVNECMFIDNNIPYIFSSNILYIHRYICRRKN